LVKDQIHCIWYCIACEGGRAVQTFEKKFFGKFQEITGDIPVIVIFTKYDALVAKKSHTYGLQNPDWPNSKTIKIGEGAAAIDFESIYRGQVQAELVKSKKKVDMERVHRLQPPSEGGVRMGDPLEETGAARLIEKTESSLEYSLRPMWVSTQRLNAISKVNGSVTASMNYFKKAAGFNAVPLVPFMDMATDKITSHDLFSAIHELWNKDEILFEADHDNRIRALILEAIFDKSFLEQLASTVWNIIDIIGPLSQSQNAVRFIKIVAGVTLIHEQLFWYQKVLIDKRGGLSISQGRGINGAGAHTILPLSQKQVEEVISGFRSGHLRRDMCDKVDANLSKFGLNWMKSYSPTNVENIIRDALRVARDANSPLKLQ